MVTRFRRMLSRMIEPLPLESDAERIDWLEENLHRFDLQPNEDEDSGRYPYVVIFTSPDGKMTGAFPVASLREAIERLRRDPNYRQ